MRQTPFSNFFSKNTEFFVLIDDKLNSMNFILSVFLFLILLLDVTSDFLYAQENNDSSPQESRPQGTIILPNSTQAKIIPGAYIVKFKQSENFNSVRSKISSKLSLKGGFADDRLYNIQAKINENVDEVIKELSAREDVEFIEPDYILEKIETNYSSFSSTEWGSTFQNRTNSMQLILNSNSQTRPIVAIVDTGLDKEHPLFTETQAVWVNSGEIPGNNIDDDGNGYVDDVSGWNFQQGNSNFADDDDHGTHVAGIVLGTTFNIFASTLPNEAKIQIMPLKFLGPSGGSTSNAIRAINYAVQMGAQVINNSWGGGSYSKALHEALVAAYAQGVFIASASGNSSSNNDTKPMYPASYDVPSNIAVAAVSDLDRLASFSNYGVTSVEIAAPGVDVYSSIPHLFNGYALSEPYSYKSGTSMAAPYISGLAALVLSEAPQLSGYQVKQLMLQSSTSNSYLQGKIKNNKMINPMALIQLAQQNIETPNFQAQYVPDYNGTTDLSSTSSESRTKSAGCGTIASMSTQNFFDSLFGNGGSGFGFLLLSLLPLGLWFALKKYSNQPDSYHRKHPRFKVNSEIEVDINGKKMKAQMNTIALGGMGFKANEALDKGGIIKMKVMSPEGEEVVEIEGKIVWAEDQSHQYGVQFKDIQEGLLRSFKIAKSES